MYFLKIEVLVLLEILALLNSTYFTLFQTKNSLEFITISVGTEFAKIPSTSTVRKIEAEGAEQSGLLEKFKDIMLKQKPESVSHLLQDNLPKCKNVWQNPQRPALL